MRVALLGCSKTKATQTCGAQHMYRSQLFRASLRYALATCDRWFVLSAKHGLLAPNAIIEPYDETLASLSPEQRAAWGARVARQLDEALPYPAHAETELVVLAGRLYADSIWWEDQGDGAREFYWDEPMAGLEIGERLAWLKANTVVTEMQRALPFALDEEARVAA